MLNACHSETTDRSAGYLVFQGPTQMIRVDGVRLAHRGMRVKWIPFWNIGDFPWRRLQVRGYPPSTLCITNSSLNFNLLAILGRSPIFNMNNEPLFGTATHYCVYSNVFQVFLSSLPTGRADRKHASGHRPRHSPRSA